MKIELFLFLLLLAYSNCQSLYVNQHYNGKNKRISAKDLSYYMFKKKNRYPNNFTFNVSKVFMPSNSNPEREMIDGKEMIIVNDFKSDQMNKFSNVDEVYKKLPSENLISVKNSENIILAANSGKQKEIDDIDNTIEMKLRKLREETKLQELQDFNPSSTNLNTNTENKSYNGQSENSEKNIIPKFAPNTESTENISVKRINLSTNKTKNPSLEFRTIKNKFTNKTEVIDTNTGRYIENGDEYLKKAIVMVSKVDFEDNKYIYASVKVEKDPNEKESEENKVKREKIENEVWQIASTPENKFMNKRHLVNGSTLQSWGFRDPTYIKTFDFHFSGKEADPIFATAETKPHSKKIYYDPYRNIKGDEAYATVCSSFRNSYSCQKSGNCDYCMVTNVCVPKDQMESCRKLFLRKSKGENCNNSDKDWFK